MRTILISILMFLILLPSVLSTTTCQISEDNSTWVNITTTLSRGCVDDMNGLGSVLELTEDTKYYVRCKNETTLWGYEEFTTDESDAGMEDERNMIAILGTLIMFMGLFLGLYFFGDSLKDYMGATKWLPFLKPVYFIIAMGISYIILWTVGEMAAEVEMATGVVHILQFLLIPYAIICILIAALIMLGLTSQAADFNKAVKEGRKDEYE